jgi:dethiobiotin synthetase
MPRGLFVTGTDTGVGKTVVCAALLHRYGNLVALGYWKPVQTGIEKDDDTREVLRLAHCQTAEGIRLPRPVSPHLAAKWCGRRIALEELRLPADELAQGVTRVSHWIVEGAGGLLVPLNERDLMADLMQALALPVIVVTRTALGTINHTLLTLEALRSRDLNVAGVVMVGDPNADNREAIEHYGGVVVLGEMPRLEPLDARSLADWAAAELDPHGHLSEFLR